MNLPGETIDGLLRNKIQVIQTRSGYRVSEDAVLLTWFASPSPGDIVLDAGAGCGAIAFGIAIKRPGVKLIGLELQKGPAYRAGRGVRLNGLESRVLIVRGDLRTANTFFRTASFDGVVSNPPYYEPARGRISLHEEKALSRHQMMMPVEDLFRVSSILLKTNGRLTLIYPVSGMERIIRVMEETGFQASRLLWIHSQESSEPGLVCLEAQRTVGAQPLREGKLILYDAPGRRSRVAEAILSGECMEVRP